MWVCWYGRTGFEKVGGNVGFSGRDEPQLGVGAVATADSDICFMTAVGMASRLRDKGVSAREVLDAHLLPRRRV